MIVAIILIAIAIAITITIDIDAGKAAFTIVADDGVSITVAI